MFENVDRQIEGRQSILAILLDFDYHYHKVSFIMYLL